MMNLLISAFGILIADRILYRLEIFNYITSKNRANLRLLSILILIATSIFKELIGVNIIIFGTFLVILMLFYVFHEKKLYFLFENRHKTVVDEIILQIQSGNSPLKAVHDVMSTLSPYERKIFAPLNSFLGTQPLDGVHFGQIHQKYFEELIEILQQKSHVIDQLETFRNSLNIQIKLRRRSRTVTAATKAQAIVATLIYFVFVFISWTQFNLRDFPVLLMMSVTIMAAGIVFIFKIGNKIKWTT